MLAQSILEPVAHCVGNRYVLRSDGQSVLIIAQQFPELALSRSFGLCATAPNDLGAAVIAR